MTEKRRRARGSNAGETELLGALEKMSTLERTGALCEMVTARQARHRRLAALCLQRRVPVLGASWCIEQLAGDSEADVRRLVPSAADAHRGQADDGFAALLHRLARDPDPDVASAARQRMRARGR